MSWSTSELRVGLVPLSIFKPSSILYWPFQCGTFLLFMFHDCLYYTVLSVPCSLVITCWERAGLLALLCVVFSCVLSLSHRVFQVRFDTWLYLFLIFAFIFTLIIRLKWVGYLFSHFVTLPYGVPRWVWYLGCIDAWPLPSFLLRHASRTAYEEVKYTGVITLISMFYCPFFTNMICVRQGLSHWFACFFCCDNTLSHVLCLIRNLL